MAQIKLNTVQIVLMAHYRNLLTQIKHMAHICENDMIRIKDMFQIVATWLQFSTEEYLVIVFYPYPLFGVLPIVIQNLVLTQRSRLAPWKLLPIALCRVFDSPPGKPRTTDPLILPATLCVHLMVLMQASTTAGLSCCCAWVVVRTETAPDQANGGSRRGCC